MFIRSCVSASAVIHPYIPVFLKELGLSPRETAIILTLGIAGSGVARAVFGTLADAHNKHALLMAICCLVAAAAHVPLYLTPPINRGGTSSVTHNFNARLLCSDNRTAICVTLDTGNVWKGSNVEENQSGLSHGVRKSMVEVIDGCSIRCCPADDHRSQSSYQTLTSDQAVSEPVSFRKDGQSNGSTVWGTSEEGDPAFSGISTEESPE